jgi:hypothetical protein
MFASVLPLIGSQQLQAGLAMGMPPIATHQAAALAPLGRQYPAAYQSRLKPDPLFTLVWG